MILNKKAQNITEPYVIVMLLIVIATFSITLSDFGADIAAQPGNKLNDESRLYIFNKSGFVPTSNITSDDSSDLFFSSDLNTSGNSKDYALEFEFYREQSSGIRTLVNDLWNVPVFFIEGLGLNLKAWQTIINLWNTIIWTIIFYAIYRIIRARIK